jgi:hypothetical protein
MVCVAVLTAAVSFCMAVDAVVWALFKVLANEFISG